MTKARCLFCGLEIDAGSRYTWHHMEGWERPGKAGGSDVMLRERTGKAVAHDDCIRRQKAGVSARQTELL